MNNPIRRFWFHHYWWIIPVTLVLVAILAVSLSNAKEALGAIATVTAAGFTLGYFVQKQKLEELGLFAKLFTRFNKRYEDLNEKLEDVKADALPDLEKRKTLNAYFNLCAEEYLFFSAGRIDPTVWKSWCQGMQSHLENRIVRQYWDKEVNNAEETYYGLTEDVIRAGAG